MMALISAAAKANMPYAGTPYVSRGKGRGTTSRRFGNNAGKYMPHQGPRECARRLRQMGV